MALLNSTAEHEVPRSSLGAPTIHPIPLPTRPIGTGMGAVEIRRLKQEWEDEYRLWRGRPISERHVYVFADGLYLKAGLGRRRPPSSSASA